MTHFEISSSGLGVMISKSEKWALAAEHGFREIEFAPPSDLFGLDKRHVLSMIQEDARKSGIRFTALSAGLADASIALSLMPELACDLLVIRAGSCRIHPADARTPVVDAHGLRRALEPMALQAADTGVSMAVEFPAAWRSQSMIDLIEGLEAPAVGVCLDLGHAHLSEGAPEAIEQLAGYTRTIHLHDNVGRTDDHRPPFSGSIEWPAVLMELEKTGYSGPLVLELAGEPDAATTIARAVGARTRLQAILDDLAQPMVFPE